MAKNPAFRLYASDFLTGVSDLTMEERGQYITLLCLQHQKGHLTKKVMQMQCHGTPAADVLAKFRQDPDGLWYNERLEEVIEKANEYSRKQSERAKKRWNHTNDDTTADATAFPRECLYDNDTDNEKEKEKGIEYPWQTEKFIIAWKGWRKYKKEQFNFKYKSTSTEQAALTELNKLANSDTQAIAIIHQSIANGWKGFFELKNNGEIKKGFVKQAGAYLAANDPDWKNY